MTKAFPQAMPVTRGVGPRWFTRLRRKLRWASPFVLAGWTACSAPEPAADPSWADVYPILQGQCLHCHGSTAARDGGSFRFDFLDARTTCKQEEADDLVDGFSPPPSFVASRREILADILPLAAGVRPKMPPEPGRLLEGWQVETIQRFIAKLDGLAATSVAPAMGPLPAGAQSPRIRAISSRIGNQLTVDYVVSDDNGDPVIGQLRVGPLRHRIESAGAGQAVFDLTGVPSPQPIDARLCDGWGIRLRGAADGLPATP